MHRGSAMYDPSAMYTPTELHSPDCTGSDKDVENMASLLKRKPQLSVNSIPIPRDFKTPLQRAVMYRHKKCVEFLLSAGADPEATNSLGTTALHFAIYEEDVEIAEILLAAGANPNYNQNYNAGMVASLNYLITSCRLASYEMVKLLLKYGAKTEDDVLGRENVFTYTFQTPISVATCEGDWQSIKILLLHGARTHIRHISSRLSFLLGNSLPQILLEDCAKPNTTKVKILKMFHLFGIDLLQKNRSGYSALAILKLKQSHRPSLDIQFLIDCYKLIVGQPLSLQCLSRIAIYRALNKNYVVKLAELNKYLPSEIMDFLHYKELI